MAKRRSRVNLPHDRYTDAELRAIKTAQRERKNVTFLDDDDCEVTVTPQGQIFYNATEWW